MRAPLPRTLSHWAGPDGPARTRSVVHQSAPVTGTRGRAPDQRNSPGLCGSQVIWLSAIASLLSQSRSCPSPEEVAAAPVRRRLTWGKRSHSSSGPFQPAQISRSVRSEEHTSELQSPDHLVCRLLLEKKNNNNLCARTSSSACYH